MKWFHLIVCTIAFSILTPYNFIIHDSFSSNLTKDECNKGQDFNKEHNYGLHECGFFTQNLGQVFDLSIKYYIKQSNTFFFNDGIMLFLKNSINKPDVDSIRDDGCFEDNEQILLHPVNIKFHKCNDVILKGKDLLSHRSNFFYDNDSSKWKVDVPNYSEILYENIYDNIDLRYYFNDKGLKYEFIVHSGGNIQQIQFEVLGSVDLELINNNCIKLKSPADYILDSNLFIYQMSNDEKRVINGRFYLLSSSIYGFELSEDYNENEDLIIDPLIYSTYIGDADIDWGMDMVVNSNGNSYVVGSTYSIYFPVTSGVFDTTFNQALEIYVLKMNSLGTSLEYSTFVGGNNQDCARECEIDSNNNIYITGDTTSSNFPMSSIPFDNTFNGIRDAFVFKINSVGSSLLFSTYIGGNDEDMGRSICIDSSFNVYICGWTESNDFPNTTGVFDNSYNGLKDTFITKLDPTGSSLIYSTYLGGSARDEASDLNVDSLGKCYVIGTTASTDFPITLGTFKTIFTGPTEIFIIQLNTAGSNIVYSTYFGPTGSFYHKIIIDQIGNVIITGVTPYSSFPVTQNCYDPSHNGGEDAYISKIDSTGSSLVFSTFLGGIEDDEGWDVDIDDQGNIYVVGETCSSDFPLSEDAFDSSYNGTPSHYEDTFLCILNPSASTLLYSSYFGGDGSDFPKSVALDSSANIYISGTTTSDNFPTTIGAFDETYNSGLSDAFLLKLSTNTYPTILDLAISNQNVKRTNSIYLYSNGTDNEEPEYNLTPTIEYRDQFNLTWRNDSFGSPAYINDYWRIPFTPSKEANLGMYDFRISFYDKYLTSSDWLYLFGQLNVQNNDPTALDISLSRNLALFQDTTIIGINGSDIEDIESNLTIELEYMDIGESSWNTTYLITPYYSNERWQSNFSVPFDAQIGNYNFRARFFDTDMGVSKWFYKNESLTIDNLPPEIVDIQLNPKVVYRTENAHIYINASDYETDESYLLINVQVKHTSSTKWNILEASYNDILQRWESIFYTGTVSNLGFYQFRVMISDNYSASTGWIDNVDMIEVLNNLPQVSQALDDISIGIDPLNLDLTPYGSDIEDSSDLLIWSIDPNSIDESLISIEISGSLAIITPVPNVIGSDDIAIILIDKDGGEYLKTDVTINIDSILPPKVYLISPENGSELNTTRPTFKWRLEYKGKEDVVFDLIVIKMQPFTTKIGQDLVTTIFTPENDLEEHMYYWKVVPKIDGIEGIPSEEWNFTIILEPEKDNNDKEPDDDEDIISDNGDNGTGEGTVPDSNNITNENVTDEDGNQTGDERSRESGDDRSNLLIVLLVFVILAIIFTSMYLKYWKKPSEPIDDEGSSDVDKGVNQDATRTSTTLASQQFANIQTQQSYTQPATVQQTTTPIQTQGKVPLRYPNTGQNGQNRPNPLENSQLPQQHTTPMGTNQPENSV